MTNIFSKSKLFTTIWFAFHFAIVIAFLATLNIYKGLNLDADFTTMMPRSNVSKATEIAEKSISANAGNEIFIIASNPDFQKAKVAAETVYNNLKSIDENPNRKYDKFKSLILYSDIMSYSDIQEFIGKYRFNLLNENVQKQINENPEAYAENSLAKFYGFSMTETDPENDPFLLDSANIQNYFTALSDSGVALSPKDGVLARFFEDKWYVMIRSELSLDGAKLANESNAIPDIYNACFPLEVDGTRFVFYGTPFHSHKTTTRTVKEITIISILSITAIVILLVIVFRNIIPIFASVISMLLSIATSFLATHAIFGNVHMIGMIFGTSLIGSCIDYSLHFFVNWKGSPELKTGDEIRKHLINGLFLSLISTEICYLLLMLAPFDMLKQIALFSFVGILSSFLTTIGIFPLLKIPSTEKRHIYILEKLFPKGLEHPENPKNRKIRKFVGKVIIVLSFAVTIVTLIIKRDTVRIQNDVEGLYTLEGRLKEDTNIAYNVIQYSPTKWLIVSGKTAEEVLQKEEEISKKITDPYICTSRLIPSIKRQKESQNAVEKLLPFSKAQYENLGFEEDEIEEAVSNLNKTFKNEKFVTPDDEDIPENLKSILKMIWIGEVDGEYYSIILPSTVKNESLYLSLSENDENLHFEDKVKDVSKGLDNLTKMIIMMFAIAFVIITIVMKFFYNFRDTFKIVTIPLISILVITTTFVISDLPIEFFCITGVILVFGLGLDYVIYKRQNKGNKLEGFAITLSFITTAISFGAVIFSTFVPVHVLGLSIFSGIIAAFICTVL